MEIGVGVVVVVVVEGVNYYENQISHEVLGILFKSLLTIDDYGVGGILYTGEYSCLVI